ncbi:MAG: HAMP domain-containing sensor histidine kinase [Candidatus Gribaldobacteria bacterium]|nr:HAMP domain-containing sensor histidine kinase [Candidatus Gribaldobacteria bacterium]
MSNIILQRINPIYPCRKYGVSLWQCPQFLFLVMGLIIIVAIVMAWFVASAKISDPAIVTLIVLIVGATSLMLSFIITSSFERLAAASRMKTEFIGIVSHQLRTPLTNLRFSLDLLLSENVEQIKIDPKEYFVILQENTKRMGVLIDNLLTISRLESGKLPLDKKLISLEEVVNVLVSKTRPFATASQISIVTNFQSNLGKVLVDPFWLDQIITNLLDNAVRYSKGGGQVDINIERKGKKILLAIKDQGVGIPKEEQKFIFEKFFRSANAIKQQTDGSGLGLYIVKKFIELLGGKIWFSSIMNKGTTFYFTLPEVK